MRSLEQKPKPAERQLKVNRPGDLHEQEADRVADQVNRADASRPRIARPTAPGTGASALDPALAATGRPLNPAVRGNMERRFGHDFGRVRVHADRAAAESARAAGANAYTAGSSIVFGAGRYNPSTPSGQKLLAHELTHVVQQSLAPGGQAEATLLQREKGDPAPAPAVQTPPQPKPDNVRDALDQLFEEFNNTIIGDTVFDRIMKRPEWIDQKVAEYDYPTSTVRTEYEKAMADWKTAYAEWQKTKKGKAPAAPKVPKGANKMTTCIETQKELLKEAFQRVGAQIKPVDKVAHYDFATDGQKNASAIGPDVWHTARPNMPDDERPKKNDIIVLSKRGESVDKADLALKYAMKYAPKEVADKQKLSEAAHSALTAAEANLDAAKKAVEALAQQGESKTSGASIRAAGVLSQAAFQVRNAKTAAERAEKALRDKKNAVPDAQKKLDEKRAGVDHSKWFFFSHVGFVRSIKKNADGTETWETFDGGQTVQDRKPNKQKDGEKKDDPRVTPQDLLQGAKKNSRTYNPKTNEIRGEESQGGDPRWLQGWIDIDKLVKSTKPVP